LIYEAREFRLIAAVEQGVPHRKIIVNIATSADGCVARVHRAKGKGRRFWRRPARLSVER